jgi:hypothetical protein
LHGYNKHLQKTPTSLNQQKNEELFRRENGGTSV